MSSIDRQLPLDVNDIVSHENGAQNILCTKIDTHTQFACKNMRGKGVCAHLRAAHSDEWLSKLLQPKFCLHFFCLIFAGGYCDVEDREKNWFLRLWMPNRAFEKICRYWRKLMTIKVFHAHMSLHLAERCDGKMRCRRFWTHSFQHADVIALSTALMRNARALSLRTQNRMNMEVETVKSMWSRR